MRVLHLALRYGGGIATAISQYAEALPDLEHSLAAASVGWAPVVSGKSPFVKIIQLDAGLVRPWRRLRELLASERYDLIHAHSSHAGALVRAMATRIPIVYTPNALATLAPRLSPQWAIAQSERLLGRRQVVIAAVSQDEAARAEKLSPGSRIVRITNRPTLPVEMKAVLQNPVSVIGSGRLIAQKDPTFFARVAELATEQRRPLAFTWLGGGSPSAEARLRRAGVTVSGWLPNDAFSKSLAGHGIYLHSAAYEGAAFAMLDTAAVGLPTVGRRVPGIAELRWVSHVDTPAEAVTALDRLGQPDNWQAAAQRSLSAARSFSKEAQRSQLLTAYTLASQAARLSPV